MPQDKRQSLFNHPVSTNLLNQAHNRRAPDITRQPRQEPVDLFEDKLPEKPKIYSNDIQQVIPNRNSRINTTAFRPMTVDLDVRKPSFESNHSVPSNYERRSNLSRPRNSLDPYKIPIRRQQSSG